VQKKTQQARKNPSHKKLWGKPRIFSSSSSSTSMSSFPTSEEDSGSSKVN